MAFAYPQVALDWMLSGCGPSVLVLADSLALSRTLINRGCRVITTNPDPARLRTGLNTPLTLVAASAESLPFGDSKFDTVLVHQLFDTANPALSLPEFARVLRPDGHLLISHLGRDDSVPWVRRLAQVMRSIDRGAMTAPSPMDIVAPADRCRYFKGYSRTFRHWEPISRESLIAMVGAVPAAHRLDEIGRQRLMTQVTAIHDQAAGNNALRLPYTLICWRGQVIQDQFTSPISRDESGLIIKV